MSLTYSHEIPARLGSAVEVLNTSLSPKYLHATSSAFISSIATVASQRIKKPHIIASLSNCVPFDNTVKFIITLFELLIQSGGV